MVTDKCVRLVVDQDAEAAYMTLTGHAVARTVEMSDSIAVDLDEYDMVVGIELLTLTNPQLPLDELIHGFHLPSDQLEIIRARVEEIIRIISGSSAVAEQQGTVTRTEQIMFA